MAGALPILAKIGGGKALLGAALVGASAYKQSRQIKKRKEQFERALSAAQISGVQQMLRESTSPRRVFYGTNLKASGTLLFAHVENLPSGSWLYLVLGIAGHACVDSTVQALLLEDNRLPIADFEDSGDFKVFTNVDSENSEFANYVQRVFFRWNEDGAGTVDPGLLTDIPDYWKDEVGTRHKLAGNTYGVLKFGYESNTFPNGVPNPRFVFSHGKKVYDFRSSSWVVSSNPVLALFDYMNNTVYGMSIPLPDIDITSWTTAANYCDQTVSGEARFSIHGSIKMDTNFNEVLGSILDTFGGILTKTSGKWILRAAQWIAPTVTLDESNARGEIEQNARRSRADIFNCVQVIFTDPDTSEAVTYNLKSSTYIAQDGEELWATIELPLINSEHQAQRLASIYLLKNRQEKVVKFPCDPTALELVPGDNVYVNNDRYGWTNKAFEVSDWTFILKEGSFVVNLELIETSSSVFNDAASTSLPAPKETNLPNTWDISAPTNLDTSEALENQGDVVLNRVTITWDSPTTYYLSHYVLQYRVNGSSDWISLGKQDDERFSFFLQAGTYDFRVQAHNQLGAYSDWTTITEIDVIGKSSPPADCVNGASSVEDNGTVLSWDAVTDLDLLDYEIRQGIVWESATPVAFTKTNEYKIFKFPPGTFYFVVKARDTFSPVRNESENALVIGFTITKTDPPPGIAASSYNGKVSLNWEKPEYSSPRTEHEIESYRVYKSLASETFSDATLLVDIKSTNFEYQEPAGGDFTYYVTAVTKGAESNPQSITYTVEQPADYFSILDESDNWNLGSGVDNTDFPDGDFSDGIDGWSFSNFAGGSAAISHFQGQLRLTSTAPTGNNTVQAYYSMPTVAGRQYKVTGQASFINSPGGTWSLYVGTDATGAGTTANLGFNTGNGDVDTNVSVTFTASGSTTDISFAFSASVGVDGECRFDNVYLEVLNAPTGFTADTDGKWIPLVDNETSYEDHFLDNSWNSPQDQIDAGNPLWVQPMLSSGSSYQKTVDLEKLIQSGRITVTTDITVLDQPATVTLKVWVSPDMINWQTYTDPTNSQVQTANFRYVKIQFIFTGESNSTVKLNSWNMTVEASKIRDDISVDALASDSGGTTSTPSRTFAKIVRITGTVDGEDFGNPQFTKDGEPDSFKTFVYNSSGARMDATVDVIIVGY